MIRQEARIDKTTGIILEFKEYSNDQLALIELYDDKGELIYKRTPKEKETYHMGKLAERIMYYENGSYHSKSNYLNGERTKTMVYFENGQIEIEGTYLNGRLHGEVLKYYPDGQLEYKRNYVNGENIT